MVNPITPMLNNYPLSNVTPFTYRDGETYLERLARVMDKVDEVIEGHNSTLDTLASIPAMLALVRQEMVDLEQRIDGALAANTADSLERIRLLRVELLNEIAAATAGGTVLDPTSGKTVRMGEALSRVYDYARIMGNFAKRRDDAAETASAIDSHNWTARHTDLSPTDTIDDDLTLAPRPVEIV